MTPNKPIIGVTGNSGSGKGTVSEILRRMGGFCLDADLLAHEVMEYGKPAYIEISNIFGESVLAADKSIDRVKLGGIVFRDPVKRKILERIVHAQVKISFSRLAARAQGDYPFIVWDAPLLVEAGMHGECGLVILVTAPFDIKLTRITARDGITEERARLRLSGQPSEEWLYNRLVTDIGDTHVKIIENTGSIEDLEYKTRAAAAAVR
ncbi:MAG: dephospho-CoA kinase [Clostridiales bacterium]|jgi:dephospho-CoA kinase|nr:dephospho-CoA kinase [Clostridiales bacterium]